MKPWCSMLLLLCCGGFVQAEPIDWSACQHLLKIEPTAEINLAAPSPDPTSWLEKLLPPIQPLSLLAPAPGSTAATASTPQTTSAMPESGTLLLIGFGLVTLALLMRRRKHQLP